MASRERCVLPMQHNTDLGKYVSKDEPVVSVRGCRKRGPRGVTHLNQLPFRNGVLDIRTGTLEPYSPDCISRSNST